MAAEKLKPHVEILLPLIYVYCNDRSESIHVSMGSCLGAFIKAGGLCLVSEAVKIHFNVIVPLFLN